MTMKIILLSFFIAVLLLGCTTSSPVYLIKTNCNQLNAEDFIDKMETKLIENNYRINKSDRYNGFLQAELFYEGTFVADPGLSQLAQYSGGDYLYMWTFKYNDGRVEASARKVMITRTPQGGTQFSRETYYNDENAASQKWYGTIRYYLEELCGDKLIFEEVKNEDK
jgi:hypothetical protein